MSVAIDLRQDGLSNAAGVTSFSWTHNNAGGTTLLVVGIQQSDGVMTTHGATAVQWDALGTPVALTRKTRTLDSSTFCQTDTWYLVSPVAGNKTITVTNDSSLSICAGSATYTGSDTTTPFGASNTSTGAGPGTQPSLTLASSAGDMMFDSVVLNDSPVTITPGASQNVVNKTTVGTGIHTGGSTDKACVGASTTMSWSGMTTNWGYTAIVIKAAGAAGAAMPYDSTRASSPNDTKKTHAMSAP
jgi:hypothetical protein